MLAWGAVSATPAVEAAKQATNTVPIVMAGLTDPVAAGIVPGLARPGRNITGLTNIFIELTGKRLGFEFAQSKRLPAVYATREWVETGGLLAYGTYWPDVWRRAATYVDRILKGAKPGDLRVEQPAKFERVVNRRTAEALGLTLPSPFLARVDARSLGRCWRVERSTAAANHASCAHSSSPRSACGGSCLRHAGRMCRPTNHSLAPT